LPFGAGDGGVESFSTEALAAGGKEGDDCFKFASLRFVDREAEGGLEGRGRGIRSECTIGAGKPSGSAEGMKGGGSLSDEDAEGAVVEFESRVVRGDENG